MDQIELAKQYFFEGLDLLSRQEYAGAEQKLMAAYQLVPERVSVLTNLSAALLKQGKIVEARRYAEKSVELDPANPEGWLNLASCDDADKDYPGALSCLDKALAQRPDYAQAWMNKGCVLHNQKLYVQALEQYSQAISLNPNFAEAYFNQGQSLSRLDKYAEACEAFQIAVGLDQEIPYVHGSWLRALLKLCEWDDLDEVFSQTIQAIEKELPQYPFNLLAMPTPLASQKKCAERYVRDKLPQGRAEAQFDQAMNHNRIRLGYFSADFLDHPVTHLISQLIELHDRSRFEIIAFSFGPEDNSRERQRLVDAFDKFVDVQSYDDKTIINLARDMEIDIAIDLMGFTKNARTEIFVNRVAPVQINYLGYAGTMGAKFMDYIIVDKTLVPLEHQDMYTEKLAYMPHSFMVNDSSKQISDRNFKRAEFDLPEDGFVFCCFNNSYKITPDVFTIWMRILSQVPGSVMWLSGMSQIAMRNLQSAAKKRGVSSDRLVFASRMDAMSEHLARLKLADLFLDTLYYNAHTTASDALWAGLPVLTCLGEGFAGRVAASLLNAVGLPELITKAVEDYEALALELATSPNKLQNIRAKLAQNRLTEPLFDTALFTRHIEAVYQAVWDRHQQRLEANHIIIESY